MVVKIGQNRILQICFYDVHDLVMVAPVDGLTYTNAQTNYSSTIDQTFASCQIMQIGEYNTGRSRYRKSANKLIQINLDQLQKKKMQYYRNRKFNKVQINHIRK